MMVDKKRKHFNPHFTYEDFKKMFKKIIPPKNLNSRHQGLRKDCSTLVMGIQTKVITLNCNISGSNQDIIKNEASFYM